MTPSLPEALAARLEQIAGIPVHLSLGANDPKDIAAADAVFVSQSVPLDLPALVEARARGVPISSMFKLFVELCPGPIVAITGSSGKSTTTSLAGEMFRQDGKPCFVGGNIGVGLLAHLDEIASDTWVSPRGEPHATSATAGPRPARGLRPEHHPQPPGPLHLGPVLAPQGQHPPRPDDR